MGPHRVLFILLNFGIISLIVEADKPNIVLIIADDLGWNDVSFHGSDQIPTPNIDLLAYSGVALGRYYSHAICTPSRSALLTGIHAYKIAGNEYEATLTVPSVAKGCLVDITISDKTTNVPLDLGMQGLPPITMGEDRGIPTNIKLLPEYFQDAGYSTHLVGKWHVGSSREEYLPTKRGFDSYFGHTCGCVDYYEYTYEEDWIGGQVSGMALFRNQTPAWDVEGYITDVYTEQAKSVIENHNTRSPLFLMVAHNAPHASNEGAILQAPPEEVRAMRHVESPERRILAAMVKKLDDSVGNIVQALCDKGILENTIIVFISDNGGMTLGEYKNYASNYPLRGLKTTPFEGGVRVVGLVWSMHLNNTSNYWDGYIHVSDWFPTLLSAAGLKVPKDIDGIDHWDSINSNLHSQRVEMYEMDETVGFASIIYGQFKLVTGNVVSSYILHHGTNLTNMIGDPPCYTKALKNSAMYRILDSVGMPFNTDDLSIRKKNTIECNITSAATCYSGDGTVCLYNILEDPCETTELSTRYPHLVSRMQNLLQAEMQKRIPRAPAFRNPLAAPSLFNYTWNVWVK